MKINRSRFDEGFFLSIVIYYFYALCTYEFLISGIFETIYDISTLYSVLEYIENLFERLRFGSPVGNQSNFQMFFILSTLPHREA